MHLQFSKNVKILLRLCTRQILSTTCYVMHKCASSQNKSSIIVHMNIFHRKHLTYCKEYVCIAHTHYLYTARQRRQSTFTDFIFILEAFTGLKGEKKYAQPTYNGHILASDLIATCDSLTTTVAIYLKSHAIQYVIINSRGPFSECTFLGRFHKELVLFTKI